jgi:ribonuclease D
VADFLNKSLDKTEQFSQWDRRPLFPKQIQYAADDVRYLHMIYPLMQKRLKDRKRLEWVKEETNRLLDPLQYVTKPADAWQRLSLRDRSPLFLGIVKALAAWREQEAQSSNKPRTHILKDASLIDIATQRVKSQESLQKIRYANHLSQSQQQAIIAAVQLGINEPKRTNTPSSVILNPEEKYITDMFKILLHTASKKHQVAERLIATGQELAELATNPAAPIPAFSDWRYEIFGKDLKALQEGKLALRLNNGKIELLEV